MADVIYTDDKTKTLSGESLNFYTPRSQRIRSLKVYFSPKQEGSGTPSPENARPISGWTGVEVGHCGKNIAPPLSDTDFWSINAWFDGNGVVHNNGAYRMCDYQKALPNTTYHLTSSEGTRWKGIGFYDSEYKPISFSQDTANRKLISSNNVKYFRVYVQTGIKDIQLEIGDSSTDYEPYKTNLLLPKEYQEVEYLESTGTQYIDTGYIPVLSPILKMKIRITKQDDRDIAGFVSNVYPSFIIDAAPAQSRWYNRYGNTTAYFPQPGPVVGQIQEWEWGKEVKFNGNLVRTNTECDWSSNTQKMNIFRARNNASVAIYSCLLYDGELVRNFIPCYRKSDSKPGMYDTITKQFYINSGTGEFLTGPAANRYDIDWSEDVGTVYGGYVDLISGELVENYQKIIIDGGMTHKGAGSFYNGSEGTNRYYTIIDSGKYSANGEGVSDKTDIIKGTIWSVPDRYIWKFALNRNQLHIVFDNEVVGITTDMEMQERTDVINTWLAENPMTFAIPLATPITHQLSPATLSTLTRDNNFWSNADRIEIEYDYIGVFNPIESRKNIFTATPHTVTAKDSIVSFGTDMAADLKKCKVYFKPKQLGEGDSSPENVRSIEGWNGITVTKCGKNLLWTDPSNWEQGQIQTGGYRTTSNGRIRTKVKFRILPNTTYTISHSFYIWPAWHLWTEDLSYISDSSWTPSLSYTFTTPSNAAWIEFTCRQSQNGLISPDEIGSKHTIQLELGDTATTYEPYIEPTEFTIPFPKTIYGGYVDLVNGEVVEESQIVVLDGTQNPQGGYTASNATNRYFLIPSTGIGNYIPTHFGVSDKTEVSHNSIWTSGNANIWKFTLNAYTQLHVVFDNATLGIDSSETAAEKTAKIKTWLANNPIIFVLPKTASAQTHYPIDPQVIRPLKGTNTIWSNSNDDIEIAYWKHNDDAYQHVPSSPILSNDNFIIVTDDGYAIGEEDDFIVY